MFSRPEGGRPLTGSMMWSPRSYAPLVATARSRPTTTAAILSGICGWRMPICHGRPGEASPQASIRAPLAPDPGDGAAHRPGQDADQHSDRRQADRGLVEAHIRDRPHREQRDHRGHDQHCPLGQRAGGELR